MRISLTVAMPRREALEYRGVHLVEAFAIRKRDEVQVGQSEAFRVMIERRCYRLSFG